MAYISVSLETDRATLVDEAISYLQTAIPGLVVQIGHPLYHLIEHVCSQHAENRELLAEVIDTIAIYLGTTIHRLPIQAATQATADTTWTITGTGPRTIPAGTEITLERGDGEREGFVTRNEATIPALASTTGVGEVEIIAINAGSQATGLQNDPQPEETFDWLDMITVVAPTTGGEDAETDIEYLNRLADKLTLQADTLVLPVDYEQDARTNVDGVDRALALDLYQPPMDEVQQVNVANATGGTATYTFEGQTTAAVNHDANAATFQAALEALSNVAPGDVVVSGGPFNTAPMQITFTGTLGGANRTQMTSTSSLTGGSASITHSTLTGGAAGVAATEGTLSLAVIDENGADPGAVIRAAGEVRQRELSTSNLTVGWITATYNVITVVFAGVCYSGFDPADVEARAEQAVLDFLDPASWGLPQTGDQRLWLYTPTVRYNDIVHIIESVEGFDYTTSVTVNGGTSNVTMTGAAPLPSSTSTASGTVTAP